jgi:carbon-monoxide dehydrogenase medium subunit
VRYHRPTTTADALAALASEPGARALVGGTDLLVELRHRKVEPTLLVDLKTVTDLRAPITVGSDEVTFGPTATMTAVADHPTVRAWCPALVEAAVRVGSVAIRNRASLLANSAHASPAADTAPTLVALASTVTIVSAQGERTVTAADFFLGPRRTQCGPGELVSAITVPRPADGSSSAFERMTRRRGVDLATCSVAAVVDAAGVVRVGLGAVGPRTLLGGPVTVADPGEPDDAAVERLLAAATPIGDVRAGLEYRTAMLRVLTRRAVQRAAARRSDPTRGLPDVLGAEPDQSEEDDREQL